MYRTSTLVVLLSLLSGCATFKSPMKWWGEGEEEIVYGSPEKIVAIWTNSVFSSSGASPVRGLGGRVYFYDSKHRPIAVEGKLAVFLYDDSDGEASLEQEATKIVHFTDVQVQESYSPSDIGPSYSFWVPWDKVGGERTQLGVIPVFTTKEGQLLVGEQARHLLPGTEPEKGTRRQVTQSNNREISVSKKKPETSVSSSTIALPPSMQQRVQMSRPGQSEDRLYGRMNAEELKAMIERYDLLSKPQPAQVDDAAKSSNQQPSTQRAAPSRSTTRALQSARLQRERRQARTSPTSQQSNDRARLLPDREGSLFDRSSKS